MNQPTYVSKVEFTLASKTLTLLVTDDRNLLYISLDEISRHLKTRLAKVRSLIAEPVIKELAINGTKDVVEAILIDLYIPLLVRFSNKGNREAAVLCEHILCEYVNGFYGKLRDKGTIVDFLQDSKPGESYPFGSGIKLNRVV